MNCINIHTLKFLLYYKTKLKVTTKRYVIEAPQEWVDLYDRRLGHCPLAALCHGQDDQCRPRQWDTEYRHIGRKLWRHLTTRGGGLHWNRK